MTASTAPDRDRPPRRRALLFRAIACGVPTTLGIVAVLWLLVHQGRLVVDPESGLPRLVTPPIYVEEPGHETTGHRYLYDPLLGWKNIPGWESSTHNRVLRINSLGLRDREHPYEKPAGQRRILLLGDSYAWGYGVSNEDTFGEILEQRLVRDLAGWEVLNSGVSGWGTDQQYLFLIEEGFKYDPDLVVVAFNLNNDPLNNIHSIQYGLHKPFFLDESLTLGNSPVPRPGSGDGLRRSFADPVALTGSIFQAMQERCLEHGCPLVIVKFGEFLAEGEQESAFYHEIAQALASQLPAATFYLDWDRKFQERSIPRDDILTGNDDGHWNPYGHQITAEMLFQFLMESGLIGSDHPLSMSTALLKE